MQCILSKHHVYINTCLSYSSTLYPNLLENMKKQVQGLVGHSNGGLCGMDTAGELRAIKHMWLNKDGVVTIIPLNLFEKIWPAT